MRVSQETLSTVQTVLAQTLDMSSDQFPPERKLDEMGIDSLRVIEVVFRLEDVFNTSIPLDSAALATVGDVADLVDRVRAA